MKSLLKICLLLCLTIAAEAEILDRMVAVVDGHIVTLSDLRQEREIRARLAEKPIDDDKVLAQEIIDNYLIDQQLAESAGVEVTDAEVDADLRKSDTRLTALSKEIRDAIRRRLRMQKYFDIRFRQSIRPTDEDVRKYYQDVFLPEARARGLTPVPPLEQVADAVKENVIQETMNHEINGWLEAIRRRSNIEIFE